MGTFSPCPIESILRVFTATGIYGGEKEREGGREGGGEKESERGGEREGGEGAEALVILYTTIATACTPHKPTVSNTTLTM